MTSEIGNKDTLTLKKAVDLIMRAKPEVFWW
jgi:hypothetical protein